MTRHTMIALSCLLAGLLMAGCQREQPSPTGSEPHPATSPPAAPTPQAAPSAAPTALDDVMERDPRYIVGISYPKDMERYPGLAAELRRYADGARQDLHEAVDGLDGQKPTAPYDLSLAFTTVADTPDIVAIAADGGSYTGGAHGNPLLARFVWLPKHDALLSSKDLIAGPAGWRVLSDYVREQLHATLSERIDADEMSPAERSETMRSGFKMIDEGSGPEADNFDQFEPVLGAGGRVVALRFVFAPYQVGPYSDGVHSVDVPVAVLLPYIAPAYRDLFASSAP